MEKPGKVMHANNAGGLGKEKNREFEASLGDLVRPSIKINNGKDWDAAQW